MRNNDKKIDDILASLDDDGPSEGFNRGIYNNQYTI